MKKLFAFLMVVGMILAASGSVLAYTTYDLFATSKSTSTPRDPSNFSLRYDDLDNDSKFSLNELVSFSGVTHSGLTYTVLNEVPVYNPVDNWMNQYSPYTDGTNPNYWTFWNNPHTSSYSIKPGNWTYSQTAVAPAVPVPPAVWLLGSGLLGLVGLRRKFASYLKK